jgi:hypothetical protein
MPADAVSTPAKRYNAVVTTMAVILTNRPSMSIGRLMGEVGWQDRVSKQIKR